MARRLPPLNALRAFEAAARLGSFKVAAIEAHVTHGAISRHVRLLEDWLGTPLFERRNRRVVLTEAGAAYLAHVSPALDRIATATEHSRLRGGRRSLRVNALPTFTLRWLLPRLAAFQKIHPLIEIQIATSNEPVEAVGEISDVVVRGGPDSFEGFQTRPFLWERRMPMCSPALVERLPLRRPADLRHHTLLHSATRPRMWNQWLALADIPDLEPAGSFMLDHFYLAVEAAIGGIGVAMGPTALVGPEIAAKRLVIPFASLATPARAYCIYLPQRLGENVAAHAFCQWLCFEGAGSEALAPAADVRHRAAAPRRISRAGRASLRAH